MIKLPLPAQAQYLLNTLTKNDLPSSLNLKIDQQVNADIIHISPDKKSIQLTIAQQKIATFIHIKSPESKQQLAQLKTGETIKLIVTQLRPQVELKILLAPPTNNSSKNTTPPSTLNHKNLTFTLKPTISLIPTTQNNKPTPPPVPLLLQTPKNIKYTSILAQLNHRQQINASIIYVDTKKITIQLLIPVKPNANTDAKLTNIRPTQLDTMPDSKPVKLPLVKPDANTDAKLTNIRPTQLDTMPDSKPVKLPLVKPDASTDAKLTNIRPAQLDTMPDSKPAKLPLVKPDARTQTKPINLSQPNSPSLISTTQTAYKTLRLSFPLTAENPSSSQPILTPQQNIRLQVIKTGAEPQFKILPPVTIEETIHTALRELLPKELPPQTLLQQLSRDLPAIVRHEQVSETLKRLAQEILKSLPSKQQITKGKHLKSALNNNGIFLETKLAQTFTAPNAPKLNTDFKANLLKLMQALQQNPVSNEKDTSDNEHITTLLKEVQSKTEGTLARLMLNQLKSLPQEDPNKQIWVIDLPFTDKKEKPTSVKIQIEENHKKTDDPEQKNWSATLTLTPPNMQTLHCKISYLNQAVHANFWSEHTKTTQIIQNNLDYLSQRLEEAGLTPGNISANQQKQSQQRAVNLDTKPLFDDNA